MSIDNGTTIASPTELPPAAPPTDEPSGGPDRPDLRELSKHFELILRDSIDVEDATSRFIITARQLTHGVAVLYFGLDSTKQLGADAVCQSPADVAGATTKQLYVLARRTLDAESAQFGRPQGKEQQVALAVPVFRRDGGVEVLVGSFALDPEDRRAMASVLQVLQLLAAFAGQWRSNFDWVKASSDGDMFASLAEAASQANQATRLATAAEVYASFLGQLTGSRLATLGVRGRGATCRLVGASHQFRFTHGAPLVSLIESASAETIAAPQDDVIAEVEGTDRETDAVRQLRDRMQATTIYRLALPDGLGKVVGACLIVCDEDLTSHERSRLHEACRFIGPHIARLKRSKLSWLSRARIAFDELSPSARRVAVGAAVAAAILLFALPFPYRVKCQCEVQPVNRRYIAAPYEGRLQDALVEPGDLVKVGQVLAIMDGREVRLELSGLAAELQRVTKQRDRALANRETAAAQIALLEMQRLQSNMQLFKDRLDNLEIRSPTDGVVISGDPKKLMGARLTIGQTLLEVGSLGEMVLEVAIPDEQIGHVQPNSRVSFRLDSMPHTTLHGRLTRVHPRSELRESKNVFIGEVSMAGHSERQRPGMRGRAKLSAGRRSLFWITFHRAIDQLAFRLGW